MNVKKIALFVIVLGFLLPQRMVIPVENGSTKDWNHKTFWYEPWGKSGVHKGIDIFSKKGTPLLSSTDGIVIFTGNLALGGNVVAVLGAKWRIHYYAHLERTDVHLGEFVSSKEPIGLVGDSGNAKGKSPHVHYSVLTLFPYVWKVDGSTQGWKKMFYLNVSEMLLKAQK
jgi:murein DD-endopeptidase MepM/ murein hydrolase activator NlpD